ncbi:MAG: hypothetical protein DRG87_04650 [Deltaproteobacteria bacterium]|nr:hypothetical protein [Deltaproteobacteria bacterium]MBW2077789.1 hypothetical protein [Deltaproteobacteria bacterium]MBW2312297.1 hypothetical protein [Deltaproteobacteria bacterium]RLB30605.1 MAG: hypothetical protein DRG87_04650 [Deltaproteobacteria bacterium]
MQPDPTSLRKRIDHTIPLIGLYDAPDASSFVPVIAPFGSGCMELVSLFDGLDIAQAVIGATDIAMRQHLSPDILVLTVTKPLFAQLCELDEKSFLYKPFWKNLRKARGLLNH